MDFITKWTNKIKEWRNSFRWPGLLSFSILKSGKINPKLEETLAEAPPAKDNWIRLGLGRNVFGPIKVWHIILLPILMWGADKWSAALKFFIDFITQGVMIIPFGIILYYIYKSFK